MIRTTLIYTAAAVLSCIVIGVAVHLLKKIIDEMAALRSSYSPPLSDAERETAYFPL